MHGMPKQEPVHGSSKEQTTSKLELSVYLRVFCCISLGYLGVSESQKNGLRFRKVQFPRLNVLAMSQHLPSYEHVHYGGGFTPTP